MTAHSPVGLYHPEKFGVVKKPEALTLLITILIILIQQESIMINSVLDSRNLYSISCTESVLMNCRIGLFKIPKTKISPDFIFDALQEDEDFNIKTTAKIVWLGGKPFVEHFTKSKKEILEMMTLTFHDKKESFNIQTNKKKENG
jgi:hypothetical protein